MFILPKALTTQFATQMTDKYPDVLQLVYQMFERSKTNGQPLESIIVDAEVSFEFARRRVRCVLTSKMRTDRRHRWTDR